jgi:hypothetical protein
MIERTNETQSGNYDTLEGSISKRKNRLWVKMFMRAQRMNGIAVGFRGTERLLF